MIFLKWSDFLGGNMKVTKKRENKRLYRRFRPPVAYLMTFSQVLSLYTDRSWTDTRGAHGMRSPSVRRGSGAGESRLIKSLLEVDSYGPRRVRAPNKLFTGKIVVASGKNIILAAPRVGVFPSKMCRGCRTRQFSMRFLAEEAFIGD